MRNRLYHITLLVLVSSALIVQSFAKGGEEQNRILRDAAVSGRIDAIENALLNGADVNSRAAFGETALLYASLFGRTLAAQYLLEKGASPNLRDEMIRSPLMLAARNCNDDLVKALIEKNANVNIRDEHGRTPLMEALDRNCTRSIGYLLRAPGLDINAFDNSFKTALDYTMGSFYIDILKKAGAKEAAELAHDVSKDFATPKRHLP